MSLEFELVLPCYNEAKSIQLLVDRAIAAAQAAQVGTDQFQLILVNNGSKDNSREVMKNLAQDPIRSSWIRIVDIEVNSGYGYGVMQGLQGTQAPYVGWSHADQQCDPKDAFHALARLKALGTKNILVKGIRHGRSLKEIFVSRVFEFFAWVLLGYRLHEINAQPKVFPRELLSQLTNPPKDFALDVYLLFCAKREGYAIEGIDVKFPPRVHGFSNWAHGLKNRYQHILNMIAYMAKLGKS